MQSLLDSNPWDLDPGCIPIPWRKDMAALPTKKLKLGIVYDDGIVRPQPPVMRAMRETAQKLKDAGHEGAVSTYITLIAGTLGLQMANKS